MAAMSGSNFYAYVLRVFKRTDKETEVYEAMTDAIMDIKLRYMFEDYKQESYIAGTYLTGDGTVGYKIDLPSDFGHLIGDVIFIDDQGDRKTLNKRSKEYCDRVWKNPEDTTGQVTGVPKDFCIFSGQLMVFPTPDNTAYKYQINYSTEAATTITSSTTAVPFTARYREYLRAAVLMRLDAGMGFDEEAAKWKVLAEEGIALMVANDEFNIKAVQTVGYNDL